MRIAACQLSTKANIDENIKQTLAILDRAAASGADVAVLPEYFDYMGDDEGARASAQPVPGPLTDLISAKAREKNMWILAGSMRKKFPGENRCGNTSLLFNRQGEITATYQKLHLYDVDLPGRAVYKESDTVIPGDRITTTEIEGIKCGMSICYDLRFPELFRLQTLGGARILFIPAAFILYTGRDHWEVLLRARAIENQCYVVAAGQVGTYMPGKACNGRSMIIDPWGTVLACAQDTVGLAIADLDFDYQTKIREEMPALLNRRKDIY